MPLECFYNARCESHWRLVCGKTAKRCECKVIGPVGNSENSVMAVHKEHASVHSTVIQSWCLDGKNFHRQQLSHIY